MEAAKPIAIERVTTIGEKNESKEYEIKINEDTYLLNIELDCNLKIIFKLRQTNDLTYSYYFKEFEYQELINILQLPNKLFEDASKIFAFYNTGLSQNKITLSYNKEKNIMSLLIKIPIGFDEVESKIDLKELKMTTDEIVKILFEEVKQIKKNGLLAKDNKVNHNDKGNNGETINKLESKINTLIEEKKELEDKIEILTKKYKEMDKHKKLLVRLEKNSENEETIDEEKEENQKKIKIEKKQIKEKNQVKEDNQEKNITPIEKDEKNIIPLSNKKKDLTPDNKQNLKSQFKENPKNLKFKEYLTNISSSKGWICNIEVFTSIKDNIEYLIYDNYYNYNLDILRIEDKTIITSLKGHNYYTSVIRYYLKDNEKEYILSCDENNQLFGILIIIIK